MLKLVAKRPTKDPIDLAAIRKRIEQGLDDTAVEVKDDLDATTKTWRHSVAFVTKKGRMQRTISTRDKIYGYVEKGTKPHDIVARTGRVLRFGLNPLAKTKPGMIGSGPGRAGSPIIFRQRVRHPGTDPRRFIPAIVKKRRTRLAENIQARLRGI
jgi:predicted DNA-binding transcriptional regulator